MSISPHLTYRPREGVVFGQINQRPSQLAALAHPSAMNADAWRAAAPRVVQWEKLHELRSGKTQRHPPGFRLTVASEAAPEIYDYPGEFAQRFDSDRGSVNLEL